MLINYKEISKVSNQLHKSVLCYTSSTSRNISLWSDTYMKRWILTHIRCETSACSWSMKHTTLSPEKAKGSPNIWIPSGGCGWPAVQMFADTLASVAGQLLPLHHTDILLRRVSFSVCVRMWKHTAVLVCLFACITVKSHPSRELTLVTQYKSLKSHTSICLQCIDINVKHVNTVCKLSVAHYKSYL